MFADRPDEEMMAMANDPSRRLNYPENILFWSDMRRRFPKHHDTALLLVHQLWGAEAVDALERTLHVLISQFPSSSPLHSLWVDLPMAWGRVAESTRRLELALTRFGAHADWSFRAYQVYLANRRFDDACAALRRTDVVQYAEFAEIFKFFIRVAEQYKATTAAWADEVAVRDYEILCIGLDRQPDRFQRVASQLNGMREAARRVSGVDGNTLPDYASMLLTHEASKRMKGTLGCFLSHVRAWEMCAQGKEPFVFIIEDDTFFIVPPPPSVASLRVPDNDFDICFVNTRTQNAAFRHSNLSLTEPVPLAMILSNPVPNLHGIGTDGYFLSREGADKLLQMVREDGLVGDVDWRLMLYASSDSQIEASPNQFMRDALNLHRKYRRSSGYLNALVAGPAIVKCYNGGSVRLQMNGLEHAHQE